MKRWIVLAAMLAGGFRVWGEEPAGDKADGWRLLLSNTEMENWAPCRGDEKSEPWSLENGVYRGFGSTVGYKDALVDFVLECEFLFDGKGDGGIGLRASRTAPKAASIGYELDIGMAPDKKQGRIRFPANPKPDPGSATFASGEWHSLRIEAKGPHVTVQLDGKQVLEFSDVGYLQGQLCLRSDEDGVKFRNLRLKLL